MANKKRWFDYNPSGMDVRLGKVGNNYPDHDIHVTNKYGDWVVWFWVCTGIDYIPHQVAKFDTLEDAQRYAASFENNTQLKVGD